MSLADPHPPAVCFVKSRSPGGTMRIILSTLFMLGAQAHAASGDFTALPVKVSPVVSTPLSPTTTVSATTVTAQALTTTAEPTLEPTPEAPIKIDLGGVDSVTLAKLAKGLDAEKDMIYFDAINTELLDETGPGIWEVNSEALLLELAMRAIKEDKTARQALKMAVLAGDPRARAAQALAYQDKLAQTYIKNAETGDVRAKEELARLAAQGNMTARNYLGLDKPKGVTPTAAVSASPTAKALSPTAAAVPVSVSPTAVPIKR